MWRMQAQRLLIGKGYSAELGDSLQSILTNHITADVVGIDGPVIHAIWTLEGTYNYGSLANDLLNPWIKMAADQFGGGTSGLQTAILANVSGGYGVGTLDLTWAAGNASGVAAGTPAQSMLTLLPDGGTTVALLGMALACLALVSRKVLA